MRATASAVRPGSPVLNPPFGFVCQGTCAGFVGPGTCTINETFTPTAAGPASGDVSPFECPNVGGQCIGIPVHLTGVGVQTAASNPSTLDYGSVPINVPKTLSSTLTIDAGYSFGGATGISGLNPPFGFAAGTCAGFVGPGTCTINETFTPTAAGPATGDVSPFECPNIGGQCIGIPVHLTGTGVQTAASNPSTLNYGSVPVNTSKTFSSTLTIDAGYSFGGATGISGLNPPFGFAAGTCAGFVGPGTCTINETFTPTATGAASGDVSPFECPVVGGQCIGIPVHLTGTGIQVATTTTLASSLNPSSVGQSVTFTATVGGTLASPAATGTVTFADGSTPLGTVPVSGGKATLTTSALAFGSHSITATYSGDPTYVSSTGALTQVVQRLASKTTLKAQPNPVVVGQTVTLTATVTGSAATPTGTVTFADGSTPLGTVSLVNGRATLTTSSLGAGSHTLSATYSGDSAYAPSSGSVNERVRRIGTATSLRSSPDPSFVGQAVTFSATVRAFGSAAVTGTVTFSDGGTTLGSAPVVGGVATLTTSSLSRGFHLIVATYSGDGTYAPSRDTTLQDVRRIATSTRLSSSSNPSGSGQAVTFTATVSAPHGAPTPTGSVTFTDGSRTLGTVALSGGQATLTTSSLSTGTHWIAASYSGSPGADDSADSLVQVVRARR